MRIGKRAACVLIAVITAVTLAWAQQDQTFLNDLLTELDDQPVTHGEPSAVLAANDVVPDATSAATGSGGGGEDVLAAIPGFGRHRPSGSGDPCPPFPLPLFAFPPFASPFRPDDCCICSTVL